MDNAAGEDDDSGEEVRRRYGDAVTVLPAPGNAGYGVGMALGVEALVDDPEAVLLLTQDAVLAPGALAALVAALRADPAVTAVGPLLVRTSDPSTVWSAGGRLTPLWRARHEGGGQAVALWQDRPAREVSWLDGAAVLHRAEALAEVPLDAGAFLYFEDVDHGVRLRRSGYRLRCVPDAIASQEPSFSSVYLYVRNRARLLRAHGGLLRWVCFWVETWLRVVGEQRSAATRERAADRRVGLRHARTGELDRVRALRGRVGAS